MRCSQCQFENPADTSFCGKCGSRLKIPADLSIPYTLTIQNRSIGFAKGTLIAGKYQILEELGRGGMGVVYKAEDTKLKRTIAIKFLSPDLLGDPDHRTRFLREAQTASALNHPHICTIHEVGEEEGKPYIAMEYVAGLSLGNLARSKLMPTADILRYGVQIAGALEHAHGRGIIHRDLKTANVMITQESGAKLLDFGLAKRMENKELRDAGPSQMPLTEAGSLMGTMHYLAPEVLRGEAAAPQSDIWALGVILYEMAAGKLPFNGKTGFELTSAILRDTPAPLPPRIPASLAALATHCLEKDPGRRFQSAGEVRAALETITLDDAATPEASSTGNRRRWRNRILLTAFAIAALVIGMTFIFKLGFPPKTKEQQSAAGTAARSSRVPEANEYFKKAMMFLEHQFDLQRARTMLERALEYDPKYAEARAWYGFTFFLEIDSGYSNDSGFLYKAEEELRRALEDDPNSARAHSSLAALYFYQGRKELTLQEAEKALKIDPQEMDAKTWLANYHASNGDYSSAKTYLNQLIKQDPLFFPARMSLGELYRTEGDYPAAIREQEKILEQDSKNIYALQKIARVFIDMNDLRQARSRLESIPAGDRQGYDMNMNWALLLALEGKKSDALKRMDAESLKYAALALWSTLPAAEFYALLGEPQKALDWLERAVRSGDERAEWFQRDPLLAGVRSDPRFKQIMDSIAYRRQQRHLLKEK
ncbi:MAG: protein kinase [Candidatus Aminicenantes bacterium]|nr:protein kinase [Candidatus Aminicenantes bacterium]